MKPSIAIIGTGIAAMGAAYFLKDQFAITFFEKNNYAGGHTHTLEINEEGCRVYIDSAFMVYNEPTYPLLTRLFKELSIDTKPTSMSFSVQHIPTGLEYCGTGLSGLFAQRINIFKPWFWKMLLEVDRFQMESVEVLDNKYYLDYTISQYVKERGYSDHFFYKFLIPMSSAVWSTPLEKMVDFPAITLIRFFRNHGFLGLRTQLPWRTVSGGSRMYRDKILDFFPSRIMLSNPAVKTAHEGNGVSIFDSQGKKHRFDHVVIATHADEALALVSDPTDLEKELLSAFSYQENLTTLHTDQSIMPRNKSVWSSWNYRMAVNQHGIISPSTIYYMNSLQQVSDKKDYFISINGEGAFDPKKVLWQTTYTHPIYNPAAVRAQNRLSLLNRNGKRFFCGSYFRYGFHEDALSSALDVARMISGRDIWMEQ